MNAAQDGLLGAALAAAALVCTLTIPDAVRNVLRRIRFGKQEKRK